MTGRASSRTEEVDVRGIRYSVRKWGSDSAAPIIFLHGTQDSSITFQFMVEQLRGDWCVVAPDWRGHGHSQWSNQGYWFHDFVADLAVLLDILFPGQALPFVGHSMGGNIASVYAGLAPERVARCVSLDGFGPLTSMVPANMRQVLTRLLALPKLARTHASYPGIDAAADRLMKKNPILARHHAMFLAEHSTADDGKGGRRWIFDPSHQMSLPSLHTMQEWADAWADITAPVLWICSEDKRPFAPTAVPGELDRRAAMMPRLKRVLIPGTGHNIHHDSPALAARLAERFIADPDDPVFDRRVIRKVAEVDGAGGAPST
ncbi:MAG: alpha/beta hydrolase [Rhizobiaceae bacterium]|nr:alpha/beta hydrolase [Rhizobiaceae bacterium]